MHVYTSLRTQGSSRQACRPERFNLSRTRAARRQQEHAPQAMQSMQSGPQDRRSAASVRLSGGLASTAASTRRFAVMPTSRPLCFRPPSCSSHHLPPSTGHRSGCQLQQCHKAGSGSKRCSLGVITRCVAAGGHSPRDTLSTLPARCAGRRRFAMSVGRMYLPRSSAFVYAFDTG